MQALNMLIYEFQIFNPHEDILFVYNNADFAFAASCCTDYHKKLIYKWCRNFCNFSVYSSDSLWDRRRDLNELQIKGYLHSVNNTLTTSCTNKNRTWNSWKILPWTECVYSDLSTSWDSCYHSTHITVHRNNISYCAYSSDDPGRKRKYSVQRPKNCWTYFLIGKP